MTLRSVVIVLFFINWYTEGFLRMGEESNLSQETGLQDIRVRLAAVLLLIAGVALVARLVKSRNGYQDLSDMLHIK